MKKPYTDEEIAQFCIKITYCQYILLVLGSLDDESPEKTKEEKAEDGFHTTRVMFYNESFIIQFAALLSAFYKNDDQTILSRLKATPAQLKDLYAVRGAVAHVADFEETMNLIEEKLAGPNSLELLPDFTTVRDYLAELLGASDPEGAVIFKGQLAAIAKRFKRN